MDYRDATQRLDADLADKIDNARTFLRVADERGTFMGEPAAWWRGQVDAFVTARALLSYHTIEEEETV